MKTDCSNGISLKETGINRVGKKVECFCDGSPYSHYMSNHCIEVLKAKIKEYEEAPIDWLDVQGKIKYVKD